jgi:formate hydrogenlyase subunit 3/multisubunit Na+/H+ antiporter MnhD subunit
VFLSLWVAAELVLVLAAVAVAVAYNTDLEAGNVFAWLHIVAAAAAAAGFAAQIAGQMQLR